MEEIRVYSDRDRINEINDIAFEGIVAGVKTNKIIYIENIIKDPINIEFLIDGEDVVLIRKPLIIYPGKIEEIEFELSPSIASIKPISARLKIKINYILR